MGPARKCRGSPAVVTAGNQNPSTDLLTVVNCGNRFSCFIVTICGTALPWLRTTE